MAVLFVNACMREGSRTERLARRWLATCQGEVDELRVGELDVEELDQARLRTYNAAVASGDFADPMFAFARQFVAAEEILIASPFWNFGIPARLHAYLELVCTQGVSFDIDQFGMYYSLCHARRLTYVTTAGGVIPGGVDDHGFGYVRTLARELWRIPEVTCIKAESLDVVGSNVDAILEIACRDAGL